MAKKLRRDIPLLDFETGRRWRTILCVQVSHFPPPLLALEESQSLGSSRITPPSPTDSHAGRESPRKGDESVGKVEIRRIGLHLGPCY